MSPAFYSMMLHHCEVMKSRKAFVRIVWNISIVVCLFSLPLYVFKLMDIFSLHAYSRETWFMGCLYVARLLYYITYVLIPIIYAIMDNQFKFAILECCCCCCYATTPSKWHQRSVRRSSSWAFSINGPLSVLRRFSRSVSITAATTRARSVDQFSQYDNLDENDEANCNILRMTSVSSDGSSENRV